MKNSPAFSKFRYWLDLWDHNLQIMEAESDVNDVLDKHGMILFFKKDDDLFGAPEESRLIFAKLKSDDEDDPMNPGFRDEARFMGINLLKSIYGDPEESIERMFSLKDLPKIVVCDRDDAVKHILNYKKKK